MLFNIFVIIHSIACFFLIVVVLMQSSKGGGLSGAFGGGGGQAIMGGRETATFLSKATTYLAVIFMVTSLSLAFLSAGRGGVETKSALRRAAERNKWGSIVPEEQKDIDEVLQTIEPPAEGEDEAKEEGPVEKDNQN
ncbi:MAG: preprotein translocase subunit SecG [Candidatus Krumholzibacteriota bacterium]|nr:preprotein translocase subunit SecG [Candidatus Krumholzibacteriota bacterium]